MAFRNVVVKDGRKIELKDLDPEERKRLADMWNRRAMAAIGYEEIKENSPNKEYSS